VLLHRMASVAELTARRTSGILNIWAEAAEPSVSIAITEVRDMRMCTGIPSKRIIKMVSPADALVEPNYQGY